MPQDYIDRPMTARRRESIAAMIAQGGPLEDYASLVEGARMGGLSPLAPATGAALKGAVNAVGGRVAGIVRTAVPEIKDEFVKKGLESFGVPSIIARPVRAMMRRSSPASSASRAGSPPATLAPPTAQGVPAAASTPPGAPRWSPQQLRNEVGLAARRQQAKLSEQEYAVVEGMVQQGVSPADAVRTVAQQVAQAAPKVKLNVAEGKEYMRLRGLGKAHQEAMEAITQQRALARKFGLPSPRQVQSKVAERNATGRWAKD